jgi:hypothetical protein
MEIGWNLEYWEQYFGKILDLQDLENWLGAYFCMGNPKNCSQDDLPTPQIPGPEVFANFLSLTRQ